jgi:competence protein ComEC
MNSFRHKFIFHWLAFPLLPVLSSLLAGKILADAVPEIPDPFLHFTWIWIGFFALIFFFLESPNHWFRRFKATFLFAFFISIGFLFGLRPSILLPDNILAYTIKIEESLGPNLKRNRIRYLADIEAVRTEKGWKRLEGRLIINVQEQKPGLEYGQILLVQGSPQEIDAATIPGQFDAKQYYFRKGIDFQDFVELSQCAKMGMDNSNPVKKWGNEIREFLVSQIETHVRQREDADVLVALLLGIRRNIDPELKAAHSAAGTSHILAVSGMHVGLIFGFLRFLLGWLNRWKPGRFSFSVLIILLLWLYALVTGLSPSVNRAVMVFSVLQLGEMVSRPKFPLNSLCLATLVLFLADPEIVYDVGYQLSFAAVYGILSFQKPISDLWKPKALILKFIWENSALTLAATLATCPIILYYFHQFPVYFLLANLIAVPLSNGLIYGGIGLISLSWIPMLKPFLAWLIHFFILILNGFVLWISSLPFSVIQNLFIPNWSLIPLFLFLILFQVYLFRFQYKWLIFCLIAFIFFSSSVLAYQFSLWSRDRKEFVIRTGNEWMLAGVEGRKGRLLFLGSDTLKDWESFEAKSLREGFHVLEIQFSKLSGKALSFQKSDSSRQSRLLLLNGKQILVLGNYLKVKTSFGPRKKIDLLICRNVGLKTIENALLGFEPKNVWLNISEARVKDLQTRFPGIKWKNFKTERFRIFEI